MPGKRVAASAVLLLLAGSLAGCSPLGLLVGAGVLPGANLKSEGERVTWEFIQAVGGLKVQPPVRSGLPARCDAVYASLDPRFLGYQLPELLTYRLWYRDSYFKKHLIAEFQL